MIAEDCQRRGHDIRFLKHQRFMIEEYFNCRDYILLRGRDLVWIIATDEANQDVRVNGANVWLGCSPRCLS